MEPKKSGASRGELWEAVSSALGWNPVTARERTIMAMAVKELHDIRASVDDVGRAASGYRILFPRAALTPLALCKHWSASLAEAKPRRVTSTVVEEDVLLVPPPPGWQLPKLKEIS